MSTGGSAGGGPATVRVAVLDAHVLVAQGLAALLERSGLEVVAVVPTWDELLAHPAMPADVVVLSRRTDAASVASAMRAGARAFVGTGDSPDDLAAAVRTAAGGGHHLADHRSGAVLSGADAGLGPREERALVLYSAGRSLREVAAIMETTEETVKSYVKRARRKYRGLGVDISTRYSLRQYAAAQGWAISD